MTAEDFRRFDVGGELRDRKKRSKIMMMMMMMERFIWVVWLICTNTTVG
jgi:hypothetical protein